MSIKINFINGDFKGENKNKVNGLFASGCSRLSYFCLWIVFVQNCTYYNFKT